YHARQISPTEYEVSATGTEATPRGRIEKIARARAAQIGVEQRLGYYKVTNVAYGFACTRKERYHRGGTRPAGSRPTVRLDVVYARQAEGPEFVSAKESFAALSSDLDSEVIAS